MMYCAWGTSLSLWGFSNAVILREAKNVCFDARSFAQDDKFKDALQFQGGRSTCDFAQSPWQRRRSFRHMSQRFTLHASRHDRHRTFLSAVIMLVALLMACRNALAAEFRASFDTDPFISAEHGWIKSSADDQARFEWIAPTDSGLGAIALTSPTSWCLCRPAVADLLPLKPDESVEVQAKVSNSKGTGWTYITIEWFDKERKPLPIDPVESAKIAPEQEWTTVSVKSAVPPSAAFAGVGLRVGANRGQARFSAVSMRTVSRIDRSGALDQGTLDPEGNDIDPAAYVRVADGHFSKGGQRLRLWGSQSSPLGASHAEIDTEVAQFRALGFNLHRSISIDAHFDMTYTRGDLSRMDLQDYTFAAMAKSGGYNWIDLVNNVRVTEADVDVVDDPAVKREDWLAAMKEQSLRPSSPLFVWDRRAQEVYFRHIDRVMQHRNLYTGLRYADDPSIALIELVNEQWWTPTMLGGADLATLHPAIIRPLLMKWNDWLRKRYTDSAGLRSAWGELLPGESLEQSHILLQPLKGAAAMDQMATVLGLGVRTDEKAANEVPGNAQRGRDVVQFFVETHREFKLSALARLRANGKPDRGASVVPVVIDTGASYSPQSAYEHTVGSGFAFGTYPGMIDTDPKNLKAPWLAPLLSPPDMGNWMVQNKIENFPAIIYETMTFQPGKYRTDYPFRLAAFAAIQDLDVVDWHFYGAHTAGASAQPLQMPNTDHYWQAVVFGGDEVLLAAQFLAGNIFLHGDLKPPATPTILVVGQDVLYESSGGWGSLSKSLAATAMQHGLRLRFDPAAAKTHYIGQNTDQYADIVKPTSEITYRWKEGTLVVEAPRVLMLAGFVPDHFDFASGESLTGILVKSPPGSAFASERERYVCIGVCSRDGKPLAESRDIVMTAVSTSCNSGFKFDVEKFDAAQKVRNHPPLSAAVSIDAGQLPVLVSRVGCTFKADWLKGMTVRRKDFSLNCYREEKLETDSLSISEDEPLFILELTRS